MLIDTHCHLTDSKIADAKRAVAEAMDVGVEKMFFQPTCIEDSKEVVRLAEETGQYAVVGVQPEFLNTVLSVEKLLSEIKELVGRSKRVIGVGEIGMDFYYDKEKKTKDRQIEVFAAQMDLAVELNLPVVIHMREAEQEMREVIDKMKKVPKGEFHCFGGGEGFLKYVLEKGFYVGFAGNVTFKSAHELRRLLHLTPLDRLLLETDSPYLSPEPVRGTINVPANVKIVAKFVANELSLETSKIIEQTGNNALCLYSLDT